MKKHNAKPLLLLLLVFSAVLSGVAVGAIAGVEKLATLL
jgi:hypothetical protein